MSCLPSGLKASTLTTFGIIQEHAVRDDFCIKAGGAEFLGDILGGGVVLRRSGHVRRGGEGLELFAGEFGVGYGEECVSVLASAEKSG